MAVVNVKSTLVSNADAVPLIKNNDYQAADEATSIVATVALGASDSNGSVYRLARINSGACVNSLMLAIGANTGSTSMKCGVLETAANGGGVANGVAGADAIFFSALDVHLGLAVPTQELTPAIAGNSASVANFGKRIWELLGLSADPFKDYDLALTQTTAGTGGATAAVVVEYTN